MRAETEPAQAGATTTGDAPTALGEQSVPTLAYALVLASFVFWTLYADWSQYNLDQFGDMLENYAWGIRWRLGNPHHPPLFGWITATWFLIFPRTDFAYHALAAANIAASLLVMLQIAKRYLGSARLYPEIFEANRPMLSDPDKIYPGQKLRIPQDGTMA